MHENATDKTSKRDGVVLIGSTREQRMCILYSLNHTACGRNLRPRLQNEKLIVNKKQQGSKTICGQNKIASINSNFPQAGD